MLLSVREAGKRLGVSDWAVRRMIANGELRVVDVGSGAQRARLRIRLDDLQAFIDARTYDTDQAPTVLDRANPRRTTPAAGDHPSKN